MRDYPNFKSTAEIVDKGLLQILIHAPHNVVGDE